MSDFSDTIERLGDHREYVVTRFAAGQTFTDGVLNPPASAPLPIVAMIQPASGRDLQRLTEGLRSSQVIVIWTKTELLTVDEDAQQLPDQITYLGKLFQVERCEPWAETGGFFEVLARKVG